MAAICLLMAAMTTGMFALHKIIACREYRERQEFFRCLKVYCLNP